MPIDPLLYATSAITRRGYASPLVAGGTISLLTCGFQPVVWQPDGTIVSGAANSTAFAGYATQSGSSGSIVRVLGIPEAVLLPNGTPGGLAPGVTVKLGAAGIVACDVNDSAAVGVTMWGAAASAANCAVRRLTQADFIRTPQTQVTTVVSLATAGDTAAGADRAASNSQAFPAEVLAAGASSSWIVNAVGGNPADGWASTGGILLATSDTTLPPGADGLPSLLVNGVAPSGSGLYGVSGRYLNTTGGAIAAGSTIADCVIVWTRVR